MMSLDPVGKKVEELGFAPLSDMLAPEEKADLMATATLLARRAELVGAWLGPVGSPNCAPS